MTKTEPRGLRLAQILMLAAGGTLLLSGCVHAVVWLFDGGSLSGPVSWRKPILFGVSSGVTVLSLAWLVGKLQRRPGDFLLLAAFSLAMVVEVGLITLEQWRGVASHCKRSRGAQDSMFGGYRRSCWPCRLR